jgi:5'-3' exonuclease
LPGVPGIGEKTAATLIRRFGGVQQLLATLDDPRSALSAGIRARLQAVRRYLELAPTVVRVVREAPVRLDRDDTLPPGPADLATLRALQHSWGLGTTIDRLIAALDAQR